MAEASTGEAADADGHRTTDLATRLFYGFGAVAQGAKSNGFNYLLLYFYSQVIGLPSQWVSFGIFIALCFDAISDPVIGYVSDNFRSRWGRRHPFMYAAGLPVAIAYYFLWSPPAWDEGALLVYFVGMAILIRTLITLYDIPATALVAELTPDYDQRTTFMSFRFFFGWWGGLLMAVMAYLVFLPEAKGGLEYVAGWGHYGLTASIVIFVSIYVSALGTHRHIPYLKRVAAAAPGFDTPQGFSARRTYRELVETLSNRSFLTIFGAATFIALASGLSTSLSIYFTRHFWEFTSAQIGYLNLPYFASAFLALFIGPAVARRFGKKQAAIGVTTVSVLMGPMPFLLRMADLLPANGTTELFWTLMVFQTVEVTLIIAASILVASMIADLVEDSEVVTGRRNEGVFFAANTFTQKLVSGLGVVAAGQLLAFVEFPTQAGLGEVPDDVLVDLVLAYIPSLWVLYLIAISILAFYRISRESHAANLEALAARRRGEAAG